MKRFISVFVLFFIFSLFKFVYAQSGKDVFNNYCTTCHSVSMAVMFNAPPVHDKAAWDIRKNDAFDRAVSKNSSIKSSFGEDKQGYIIDELVSTAIMGTAKGMPPKGTCMECSEDDLRDVIKFMSS